MCHYFLDTQYIISKNAVLAKKNMSVFNAYRLSDAITVLKVPLNGSRLFAHTVYGQNVMSNSNIIHSIRTKAKWTRS